MLGDMREDEFNITADRVLCARNEIGVLKDQPVAAGFPLDLF